jgi:uncharacterized Zn finger protein (UPF0148 family)
MACVKCEADLGGAKFCPACGQLNGGPSSTKVAKPATVQKEEKKLKKDYFEQKIKEAAPKEVSKKKTWAQTNTGGDMYGAGKFKGKSVLNGGPPPEKKSLSDLP